MPAENSDLLMSKLHPVAPAKNDHTLFHCIFFFSKLKKSFRTSGLGGMVVLFWIALLSALVPDSDSTAQNVSAQNYLNSSDSFFEPSGFSEALKLASSSDQVLLVTLANMFVIQKFVPLQLHSIKKYSKIDWGSHYVIITPKSGTLDMAACLELDGPTCIEDNNLPDNKQHGQAMDFASPSFFQAVHRKASILAYVSQQGYTGIFIDYDVVLLGALSRVMFIRTTWALMHQSSLRSPRQ